MASRSPIGKGGLLATAASTVGVCAGLLTIHAIVTVPLIIEKARGISLTEIQQHAAGVHAGAVSRNEWTLILQRLDQVATKSDLEILKTQIDSVKERLGRIEQKMQ